MLAKEISVKYHQARQPHTTKLPPGNISKSEKVN